jgi:7-carboxy-7-deazaguanine synthase
MTDMAEHTAGAVTDPLPRHLPFVEAFGPTIQGEGVAAGRLSSFLRFGGCNLSCSWCDSAYTWDAARFNLREEIELLTVNEIIERTPYAPIIVLTGGEPLLNQNKPEFIQLLTALAYRGSDLHMETNGTIVPNPEVVQLIDVFSVSPKLGNAGLHKRTQSPALAPGWGVVHHLGNTQLKVVVQTPEDVSAAVALASEHDWPLECVWVMPEGVTKEVLNHRWPMVAEEATRHGINATHRLHILAWNDERGH